MGVGIALSLVSWNGAFCEYLRNCLEMVFMDSSKEMKKEKLRKIWSLAKVVSLGVFFFGITVFVFLNSFEIVFNRNVSFVGALERFRSKGTIESVLKKNSSNAVLSNYEKDWIGDFGIPKTLKVPTFGSRLPLSGSLFLSGEWLVRSGNGHFLIMGPGKNGNVGDIIIYSRSGWRTISSPERLSIGDNIFLETDTDWRYMFRVASKGSLRLDQPFVKSDTDLGSLILLIEDESRGVVFAFECILVSIQNIRQ